MNTKYRMNNHKKVLSTLNTIDPVDCRQVMSNYDSYMESVQRILLFETLSDLLNTAELNYKHQDPGGEKRTLKKMLKTLKLGIVSDRDLENKSLRDYSTRTTLTIQKIENRIIKLNGMYRFNVYSHRSKREFF
ncbi:MAG: hypothetical protein R6V27_13220 [Balneolaceae bacterium]